MNTLGGSTVSWSGNSNLQTPSISSHYSESFSIELSVNNKYGTIANDDPDTPTVLVQDNSRKEEKGHTKVMKFIDHVGISFGLAIGTYIGVTLRIYLSYLSQWDGIKHFPSIWAQIIGTGLIGFFIGYRKLSQHKVIYTSLATGLCGSLTTFSSWNSEASMVLLQLNKTSFATISFSNYWTGTLGAITVLLLGVGMPVMALLFGRNVAQLFTSSNSTSNDSTNANMSTTNKRKCIVLVLAIVMYIIVTCSIVTSCVMTGNYYIMFSLLLGWPGTYIRWCLSNLDTYLKSGFPLGTFLANAIGSIILAGTLVARAYVAMETSTQWLLYSALSGIITGFCGSLTTVSTFASQLVKTPFRIALLYALVSLGVTQVMFTIILGTYSWTKF